MKIGTGILKANDYYGLTSGSFFLNGFDEPQKSLMLKVGFDYSPLQNTDGAIADTSIVDFSKSLSGGIFMLNIGFERKYYTTSSHTFLGNYFSFGAKAQWMFLEYKNPLEIEEYDEDGNFIERVTVSNDILFGLDLNVTAGLNFMQFEKFKIGAEVTPGVIIWWITTFEGFDNDVFSPMVYLKANFTLQFK